ncbi:ATP-binding cassette domain-containing protein [Streptomyces sp. NPDC059740]|uniref:ABC transporter ATP-binding protein n=1 Tax=Streptomyces sp. NPDC059740 TaxID=3346926 RepID=UPI00365BDF2D
MTKAISVAGLHKSFGRTHALDGLDLTVEAGEVHGFLGPNGAGKSTAVRVLLGLLRADSGAAQVLGHDPWREAVELHRRLAYVPGDVTLWRNLTGGEVIDLYGRLHRPADAPRRGGPDSRRRDELLDLFDLDPTKKGRTYSKGNRQKVALVAAFASDAELLVLDEPTSGLDPLMEAAFQRCVREARSQGRTVLLSSHVLTEVEAVCDRVSIVRRGRTVESGTLTELRHLTRTDVTAELRGEPADLTGLPGVHEVELRPDGQGGAHVSLQVDGEHLDGVLRALTDAGVRSLTSAPPTLEALFLRHYADGTTSGENPPGAPRPDAGPPDGAAPAEVAPDGARSGAGARRTARRGGSRGETQARRAPEDIR